MCVIRGEPHRTLSNIIIMYIVSGMQVGVQTVTTRMVQWNPRYLVDVDVPQVKALGVVGQQVLEDGAPTLDFSIPKVHHSKLVDDENVVRLGQCLHNQTQRRRTT